MTRLFDIRLGALASTLSLAVVLASLTAGAGCKKATKKDESQSTKTAPAKSMGASPTMGTKESMTVVKDGSTTRGGVAGTTAPAGMAATPPATGQPRPTAGPVKVQLVVGLNATKLRKTFLWTKLMSIKPVKKLLSGKTYGHLKLALGQDPIQIVHSVRVVLGGKSLNDIKKPEHLAIYVSGRFDASATLKKLLFIPVKVGNVPPVITKINGKDAIRGKSTKGESFAVVAVNKNTLAMCSDSMLDIVTKGDITGGSAAIAAQIKAIDAKSLAWIVFGGVKVPLGNMGAMPALAALSKIQGGSVVLDSNKAKWKVVNRLDVGSPQAAKSLLQFVNMMKMAMGKASGGPGAPPAAVGAILKRMNAVAKGQIIIATVELDEANVKKLLDSLLKKL